MFNKDQSAQYDEDKGRIPVPQRVFTADEVDAVLRNQPIEAIKSYRVRYNLGLRESKDAIDALAERLGLRKRVACAYCNGTGTILRTGVVKIEF